VASAAQLYTPWGNQPIGDSFCDRVLGATVSPPPPANDNLPKVVALAGVAGSGKSTAAQYLVDMHGYTRLRFAGPLKAAMAALGFSPHDIDGVAKEAPHALLCGKTPRHAMQTLGTEWGRNCIGADFWIGLWQRAANDVLENRGRVVVDDCRFPNEAAVVRKMGGEIFRIVGRGGIAGDHASERQEFVADVVLENDGDLVTLFAGVENALTRWTK